MIESLLATWDDPHSRHAMLVHFPIVLGAIGIIPAAALVICTASKGFASRIASWVCIVWFAAACVSLGMASGAGEEAYERVEESIPRLSEAEDDALERHESLGEGAWLWALPPLLAAGGTLVPRRKIQIPCGAATLVAAIVLAGFVAIAGHTGGLLVYEHGLGVPDRAVMEPSRTGDD